MQRHYNAAGEMVGTTETLSTWTDDLRAEAEALWEADQLVCPQCGNLREECADPEGVWYPQRHICYASRTRAAAEARYDAKHKDKPYHSGTERGWAEKWSDKTPFHFRDGVRVYVAGWDVHPDDKFI